MTLPQGLSRTLILGIDGADWRVVKPLIEQGALPNLAAMMDRGVYGELTSTYPWNSVAAWSSFQTGLNPGQHGLFDFYMSGMYERKVINAEPLTGHSMWDLLGAEGYRVGAVNVPISYPPRPVNGFLIPGLLTPAREEIPTHPPGILAPFPDYVIEPRSVLMFNDVSEASYLEALHAAIIARGRAVVALAQERPWEFLAVVFTETDRLHHFFWKVADPTHPDYDPAVSVKLLPVYEDCYRQIDRILGELQEIAGEDALTIVMSDHGFGPVSRGFDLSTWLIEKGYLTLAAPGSQSSKRSLLRLAQKLDVLGVRRVLSPRTRARAVRSVTIPQVDWSKTLVYPGTIAEQALYVNTVGREAGGIVEPGAAYAELMDRLVTDLQAWRDPSSGAPVVGRVIRRDEVNHGAQVSFSPDLYLEPHNEHHIFVNRLRDPHQADLKPERVYGMSGHHRLQGIYAAAGPCIAPRGAGPQASITDICPTVLYAMQTAVPANLDGRALVELFTPDFAAQVQVRIGAAAPDMVRADAQMSDSEDAQVRARLRSLGYL